MSKWFTCFDIVINTWAVTGCFDFTVSSKTRKYVYWAEVQSYMFELTLEVNELKDKKHDDINIYHYL